MSDFDQSGVQLDQRVKRPARFTDRLARTFGGFDRTQEELPGWQETVELEYPVAGEPGVPWDQEHYDRFPVSRHGYDRAAVDAHVSELERELAELRDHGPAHEAVATEIRRIGEQTAAILQVAHKQAFETKRGAQAEADRCLSDAAANALAITDEAHQRLRQLDADADQVWQERGRLIDDVRTVANALLALADDATARFPAEPERAERPLHAPPRPQAAASGEDPEGDGGLPGLA